MPGAPLEILEDYVQRGGHALVPKGHIEEGFVLGQWVAKRRLAYQQDRVDPERSSRLEELPGWSWTPRDDRWRSAYDLLLRFVRREGHAFVRQDVVQDRRRLGVWAWEQRRAYKLGKLSRDRTSLLSALPGWSGMHLPNDWISTSRSSITPTEVASTSRSATPSVWLTWGSRPRLDRRVTPMTT